MNNYRLLTIFFLFCCKIAAAQKIQYSKSVLKTPGGGDLQLIADVNGFHHLIHFSNVKKPVIHIFNEQLQLQATRELNIRLAENADIRLLKVNDYYVLYAHTQRPLQHLLIKIYGNGSISDISYLLNDPADSSWNKSKATFQLFNIDHNFFLVSHTYYNNIKKIKSTVVKLEPERKAEIVTRLIFPFNIRTDELREVTLSSNNLFIVKTSQDESGTSILTLLKINCASGDILSKQFESGKYLYSSPTIRYNSKDSSVFIYSLLRTPPGFRGVRPGAFMVRLNHALNETAPISILPDVFKDNTASSFIVEKNKTTGWLLFSAAPYNRKTGMTVSKDIYSDLGPNFTYTQTYDYSYYTSAPTAVRMTLLNSKLEKEKDSLIKNNGNYYKIHPAPYSQFVMHNTSYLLLVQELVAKKRGLLLVYPNDDGHFNTLPVRVYHQFNFMLSLLQTVGDNYFIVPFTNKTEMGLMKVSLNN
ncbi:hypothetical protein [Lacibacter sediminis]|uniref:Uncharacterized protein n=1 Tax=Lacibacter sediminis TaxID=2760713 RepID=A0A7G5XAZ3_9BACT|nr:hypothetical protein [Lacibacter sediminis]QNA42646.1 hypothetical protein H4075_11055 [Lacibacter sediminis]